MFSYKGRSATDIRLRLLDHALDDETYASVLHTLGAGVRSAAARITEAEDTGNAGTAEFVTDIETETVENLLGAAYVVCQAQITAVAQVGLRIRGQALKDGLTFSAFGGNAHDVRALGEAFDSGRSKIEVLWALGNYFKHREEWSLSTWSNPTGVAQHTIPVITAAGLTPGSTGNLRTGAKALGNADYSDMTVFETIIRAWSNGVRNRTRTAFGRS